MAVPLWILRVLEVATPVLGALWAYTAVSPRR